GPRSHGLRRGIVDWPLRRCGLLGAERRQDVLRTNRTDRLAPRDQRREPGTLGIGRGLDAEKAIFLGQRGGEAGGDQRVLAEPEQLWQPLSDDNESTKERDEP